MTPITPASASNTLVINKANPVITVAGVSVPFDNKPHAATATAAGVESPTPVDLSSLVHLSYKNLATERHHNLRPGKCRQL